MRLEIRAGRRSDGGECVGWAPGLTGVVVLTGLDARGERDKLGCPPLDKMLGAPALRAMATGNG